MHGNKQLIQKFYSSFQNLDIDGMRSCYDEEIRFSDPVFPYLKRGEAVAMWQMLVDALKKNGKEWKLTVKNIVVNDTEGSCQWEAHYVFSKTGRKVHNIILAKFQFRNGKIVEHTDYFNLYRWSRMAFGIVGVMLGWTKFFQNKVRANANQQLQKFMANKV